MLEQSYSRRKAFILYKYYVAIKRHFSEDGYDFLKYHGIVKVSERSFEGRKDKSFFYRMTTDSAPFDAIFANVLHNSEVWIGDICDSDQCHEITKRFQKRIQGLTYHFKEDIKSLNDNFDSNVVVKGGQHPPLLQLYLGGKVGLETIIILNDLTGFFSHWRKKISDPIMWPDINRKCDKYKPFLEYDKAAFRQIVLERFRNV